MNAAPSTAAPNHPESWAPILELAVQEVFEIMVGRRLEPGSEAEGLVHGEFTAMIGLAGSLNGILTFCCGAKSAAQIAARMLAPETSNSDRQVWDAIGEICNMIAGNFKNKLTGLDGRCLLSVPTVVIGAEYRFHTMTEGNSLRTVLRLDGEAVVVRLQLQN
jgi:chemotaxis protein CheX